MAGLFARLSQRVLAPEGNVQPAAFDRAPDLTLSHGPPPDASVAGSFVSERAPVARGAATVRQTLKPASEAATSDTSSARNTTPVIPDRDGSFESASVSAPLPWSVAPVQAGPPPQPGLEGESAVPRRLAPDVPADPVREVVRAARDIVAHSHVLPARRASRDALPTRANEPASESPVIHVTIDRIDVHQPPAAAPAMRAPSAPSARISLGDYLSGARRKP